ncbi:MAG: hypothetical protein HY096_03915 [Nitrospinae bacterium]|nr:hypothetical protein [Nitrospinota bacterium]
MKIQNKFLKSKDFTRLLNGIYKYNSSDAEFLMPILSSKKSPLNLLKKLFNGISFLLKSVNMEKIGDNCYVLVVKGKKQKFEE